MRAHFPRNETSNSLHLHCKYSIYRPKPAGGMVKTKEKHLFLYLGGDLGDGVGVASDGAGLPPVPHAPHAPEKRVI
jgi:hypothetical protein